MSRSSQEKEALVYFPLDTTIFEDRKILMAEEKFGELAGYLAIKLLCWIYKRGYFLEYSEEISPHFARLAGRNFTSTLIIDIINYLCDLDFFDKKILESHHILTSHGIQKRYIHIQKLLRRTCNIKDIYKINSVQDLEKPAQKIEDSVQDLEKLNRKGKKMIQKQPQNNISISILSNTNTNTNTSNSNNNKKPAQKIEDSVQDLEKPAQKIEDSVQDLEKPAQKIEDSVQDLEKPAQKIEDSVQIHNFHIDISKCLDTFFNSQKYFQTREAASRKVFNPKDSSAEQTNVRLRKWGEHFNEMLISQGDLQMQLSGANGWIAYFRNWLNYIEGRGVIVTQDPPANFQPRQYDSLKNKNSRNNGATQGLRGAAIIPDGDKDFGKL